MLHRNVLWFCILPHRGISLLSSVSYLLHGHYDWPTGHLIVLHYITERLATEHELLRLKEEAEHVNETKSHFLAQMNHELRILLYAIMGYAERRKSRFDCAGLQSAPQTCRCIARI